MTDPAQTVEATPETDAILPLGSGGNMLVQHVSIELAGLSRSLERRLNEANRQLHLAQTENAGHIRIEDELKAELRDEQMRHKSTDDRWMRLGAKYERDLTKAQARCAELEKALTRIEEWSSFPMAEWNGEPCSYGVAYGSNGERDYMRGIAKVALKASPKPSSR